nr:hypothetical protein [Microbacterium bovistercoris]
MDATITCHPFTFEARRNLCEDPAAINAANYNYSSSGGAGSPALSMLNSAAGLNVVTYANVTFTTATSGWAAASCDAIRVEAGTQYTMSLYGFQSLAGTSCIRIGWYDASGTFLSEYLGPVANRAAGVWTRLSGTAVAPAGAVTAWVGYRMTAGSAAGLRIGITQVLAEDGAVLGDWFYGDTPDTSTPPAEYSWARARNNSASVKRTPSSSDLIATKVEGPWQQEFESSNQVHRYMDQPSSSLVTVRPGSGRAGTMVARFDNHVDANDAFRSLGYPHLWFELTTTDAPVGLDWLVGLYQFIISPDGRVALDQQEPFNGAWAITIPWTEVNL